MNRLERHLTSTAGHTFAPWRSSSAGDYLPRVGNALRRQSPQSSRAVAAANFDTAAWLLATCAHARAVQPASWAQVDAYRARMREARELLAIARMHLAPTLSGGNGSLPL